MEIHVLQGGEDVKDETDCRTFKLDPDPPETPIALGSRTRLALIIAENDNGEIDFEEYDPVTGERVEEAA